MQISCNILICFLLTFSAVSHSHAADALADLKKFSVFDQADPSKLAGGKVISARGPALEFPRDLAIQAIYVVPAPLQKTVELHKQWDPTRNPELKVYLHGDLPQKPAPGDFSKLAAAPENRAVRELITATQKLPYKGDLQLSSEDTQAFTKASGDGSPHGTFPAAVYAFWSRILAQRTADFAARGLGGLPPYEFGNQSAHVSDEVSRLLKEQPKVRVQFRDLINQTPLGGGTGSLPPSCYWELFDVEGQAALSLGVSYSKVDGDTAQLLDMQYYSSGGYFTFLTLYQMWPIIINGRAATLVWRGDSIASLSLSDLHGVERMGSSAAMMKEVQKTIGFFQKDVSP